MAKKEILNNDALTIRANEGVVNLVEDAVDTVTNAVDILDDQVERIVTVTKNNPLVVAAALIAGIAIGGFVAYKVTKKRLTEEFEDELTEQIAAAKEFHRRVAKEGEFESPESAVKALVPDPVVEAMLTYQGRETPVPYHRPDTIVESSPSPVDIVVEEVTVNQNVFVQSNDDPRDWDYNAELADRELHPDIPYVISFEEFNENEPEHEQTTLTYYEKDDALVDAKDSPIDNTEYTVGDDNLNRFGDGSGDPNVVYIRNEKIDMDFEVVRDKGSYHKQIFGTEPETNLSHSRRRPDRRSWRADE